MLWKNLGVIGLAGFLLLASGCERKGSQIPYPNQPPETWLVNVPPENDSTSAYFPLIQLAWNGGDNDGYVVGFYYRWNTYHIIKGDSIIRDFRYTTAYGDTIAFESSDRVNLQVVEVKAVDNEGAVDPTPAVRRFYTRQVEPPETEILWPADGSELFALDHTTDTWPGIVLCFRGSDTDGEVTAYSWKVDTGPWSDWSADTLVVIRPGCFDPPLHGQHTIAVKAKDNTEVEDPTPATVNITLAQMTFEKGILVLDETYDGRGGRESPSDGQVDEFYQQILNRPFDSWDFGEQGLPPKEILCQYRLLIWHSDDRIDRHVGENRDYLADYLNAGGKLWLSGWNILSDLGDAGFPVEYTYGDFPYDYLHLISADKSTSIDFSGAEGVGSFPSIEVDGGKLLPFRKGRLHDVNVFEPGAFAEEILLYQSASRDPDFHGKPCAIKYSGTTYKVVFLGFPLFYIKQDQAAALAQEILRFLGE